MIRMKKCSLQSATASSVTDGESSPTWNTCGKIPCRIQSRKELKCLSTGCITGTSPKIFKDGKPAAITTCSPPACSYSKFQYPDLATSPVLEEIEKLRRNIWLELNNYLTPLEQVNVLTSIIYGYYNLKGTEVGYQHPEEFLIHKLIETKRGNAIINGIRLSAVERTAGYSG